MSDNAQYVNLQIRDNRTVGQRAARTVGQGQKGEGYPSKGADFLFVIDITPATPTSMEKSTA